MGQMAEPLPDSQQLCKLIQIPFIRLLFIQKKGHHDIFPGGQDGEQIELLQNDPEIKWTALQQGTYDLYGHNGQKVYLTKNDDAAITMMTKITDGRLPQKSGEIVAERGV